MKVSVLLVDNQKSCSHISRFEPQINPLPYLKKCQVSCFYLTKKNSIRILSKYYKDFDVFLNLCDGAKGDDRPGIEVVKFLERHNLPFTGAGSKFYEPSRIQMKKAAIKNKVCVPAYQFFYCEEEIKTCKLSFPRIVKHYNSYSSIGITKKSLVENPSSFKYQVKRMIKKYGGALVEEYIKGREFTVLVVSSGNEKNPYVFEPVEIIFPEGEEFKHFDIKWKQHSQMKFVLCKDTSLTDYLKKKSMEIYKTIHGSGYARFDYRIDSQGNVFFLELNPNGSVYYPRKNASSADEILFLHSNGHEVFTSLILNYAFKRKSQ